MSNPCPPPDRSQIAVAVGQQTPLAAFAVVAEALFSIYRANVRQAVAGGTT